MHLQNNIALKYGRGISETHPSVRRFLRSERRFAISSLLGQLRALVGECSVSNWDGYGADPVLQQTHETTRQLLTALPHDIPLPVPGAEADGHLTIEWYRSPQYVLSVSVSPDGMLYYAALLGKSKRSGTEPFSGEIPEDIVRIVRRLFAE